MPLKDPEARREYNRKWREAHRAEHRRAALEWNRTHREQVRKNNRAYRLRHPDRIKYRKKKWEESNRVRLIAKRAAERAAERATFIHDCAAWAAWRAKWRIIYAKRVIRRGKCYTPRYYLRFPDYAVKAGVIDVRSAFLEEGITPEMRAYARELAIERRTAR